MPSECPHIQFLNPDLFIGGPPRDQYAELRKTKPVCWLDDPYTDTGYWAVTGQNELDFISKNPLLFSSEVKGVMPKEPREGEDFQSSDIMLSMDPPRHMKYRRIVRGAFTPKAVESYEPRLQKIAQDIVARVLPKGKCEFVADIAAEFPLVVICELLGVPQKDRATFFAWSNTMIGDDDPEYSHSPEDQVKAMTELYMYADVIMAENRENPQDNVVGRLLRGDVDGERLSESEFRNFMLLLIVAGNETTRNQTSHIMRLLIEHPEQYQMLVDNPELLPDAVNEGLRYNSPVIMFRRTAMEDVQLANRTIRKDDKLILFYQSASSDERYFKDPDVFDITRPQREPVADHLRAFGIGEHYCLGLYLARMELKLMLRECIEHMRNPQFAGEVEWLRSHFINGIKRMPITFDTV